VRFTLVALLLYVGGYVAFRQSHMGIWDRDKRACVIFPATHASMVDVGECDEPLQALEQALDDPYPVLMELLRNMIPYRPPRALRGFANQPCSGG
jgi:hypothetical protein